MFLLALFLFAGQQEILREFQEFLSIPNVASDTANIRRNADWLTPNGIPGSRPSNPTARTPGVSSRRLRRTCLSECAPHGHVLRALRRPAGRSWRVEDAAIRARTARRSSVCPRSLQQQRPHHRDARRARSPQSRAISSTSSSSSKARRRPVRRTSELIASSTEDLLRADAGSSATDRCTSGPQAGVFGVRGDARSTSRSTARTARCTAATTETGRRIRRLYSAKLLASMKDDRGNIVVKGWAG